MPPMDTEPEPGAPGTGGEVTGRARGGARDGEGRAPEVSPDHDAAARITALLDAHLDRVHDVCHFVLGAPPDAAQAAAVVMIAAARADGPVDDEAVDAYTVDVLLDRAPRDGTPPVPEWPPTGRAEVDAGRARIAARVGSWTALERAVFALRVRHERTARAVARATGVAPERVDELVLDLVGRLSSGVSVVLGEPELVRGVLPMLPAPEAVRRAIAQRGAAHPRPGPVADTATTQVRERSAAEWAAWIAGWRRRRLATGGALALLLAGIGLVAWGLGNLGSGGGGREVVAVGATGTTDAATTARPPTSTRAERPTSSPTATTSFVLPTLPSESSLPDASFATDSQPDTDPSAPPPATEPTLVPPPETEPPPGTILTIPTTTPGTLFTTTAPTTAPTTTRPASTTTTTTPPATTTATTQPPPTTSPETTAGSGT
jgi:hypothetical protein